MKVKVESMPTFLSLFHLFLMSDDDDRDAYTVLFCSDNVSSIVSWSLSVSLFESVAGTNTDSCVETQLDAGGCFVSSNLSMFARYINLVTRGT